jgi:hypothetical protein
MEPTSTPTNQSQNPTDDQQRVQAQAQAENAFEEFVPNASIDNNMETTVTTDVSSDEALPNTSVVDYQTQSQSDAQQEADFTDEKMGNPVVGYENEESAGEVISPSSEPSAEPQIGTSDDPTIAPDTSDQEQTGEEQYPEETVQDGSQQSSTNSDELDQDQEMAAAAATSAQLNSNGFDKMQTSEVPNSVIARDVSSKKGQIVALIVIVLIAAGVGVFYLL